MAEDDVAQLALHLRTVHFSLTVLSLGLMFAVAFGSTDIDRALVQLQEITEASRVWDGRWVETHFDEVARGGRTYAGTQPVLPASILISNKSVSTKVDVEFPGGFHDWTTKRPVWGFGGPIPSVLERPRPLVQFKTYWESLSDQNFLIFPRALSGAVMNYQGVELAQWTPAPANTASDGKLTIVRFACGRDVTSRQLQPALVRDNEELSCAYLGSFSAGHPLAGGVILLPTIDTGTFSTNAQLEVKRHLAERNMRVNWPSGRFEHSFPELSILTSNFDDLPMNKIQTILEAQKLAGTESVQFIGIKLPARGLRFGGALLLLGVQAYFLLHLIELVHRLAPGNAAAWGVAWIALYSSGFAVVLSATSALILPVSALLVVSVPILRTGSIPSSSVYILFVALSLFLAYRCGISIRKLNQARRMVNSHPGRFE